MSASRSPQGATSLLPGSYPPSGRAWAEEKIATLCVFNALFRSKQWNGRIDPFHHDHVADFACRGPAIVRRGFRHLIDCPAMGACEVLYAVTLNLHLPQSSA